MKIKLFKVLIVQVENKKKKIKMIKADNASKMILSLFL